LIWHIPGARIRLDVIKKTISGTHGYNGTKYHRSPRTVIAFANKAETGNAVPIGPMELM